MRVSCDINADEEKIVCVAVQEQFDIISMNGTLEVAVNSSNQYLTCLFKLKKLLKIGGVLIGVQFLDTTLWQVQGETYGCVPLTEDMVVVSFQ